MMVQPWSPADLCGHLDKQGHSDGKWRRRYCALKAHQLFILRTAASLKPLAVLDLSGARITASKTPLHRDDGSDDGSGAGGGSRDVLWVLRVALRDGRTNGHKQQQSGHTKYKLAAPSQELQELWVDALQQATAAGADAAPVTDEAVQLELQQQPRRHAQQPQQRQQQQQRPRQSLGSRRPSTAPASTQDPSAAAVAAAARPVGRTSSRGSGLLTTKRETSWHAGSHAGELLTEPAEAAAAVGPDRRRARSSVGVKTSQLQQQQQWLLQQEEPAQDPSAQHQRQQLHPVARHHSSAVQKPRSSRGSAAAEGPAIALAAAAAEEEGEAFGSYGAAADADIESDGDADQLLTGHTVVLQTRRSGSTARISGTAVLQDCGQQYTTSRPSLRQSQLLPPPMQQPSPRVSFSLAQAPRNSSTQQQQQKQQQQAKRPSSTVSGRQSVAAAPSKHSLQQNSVRLSLVAGGSGRSSSLQQRSSRHSTLHPWQELSEPLQAPPSRDALQASAGRVVSTSVSTRPASRGVSLSGAAAQLAGGEGSRLSSAGGDMRQLQPQRVSQLQFMAARLAQPQARRHSTGSTGDSDSGDSSSGLESRSSSGSSSSGSRSRSRSSRSSRSRRSSDTADGSGSSNSGGSSASSSSRRSSSSGGGGGSRKSSGRRRSSSADAGRCRRRRVQQPLPTNWGWGQWCCWLVNPVSSGDSSDSSIDSDNTLQSWGKLSNSSSNRGQRARQSLQLTAQQDKQQQQQQQQRKSRVRASIVQQQQRSSSSQEQLLQPPSQQRMSGCNSVALNLSAQQKLSQLHMRPRSASASASVYSSQPLSTAASRRHSMASVVGVGVDGLRASVRSTAAAAAGQQYVAAAGSRHMPSQVNAPRRSQLLQGDQQQWQLLSPPPRQHQQHSQQQQQQQQLNPEHDDPPDTDTAEAAGQDGLYAPDLAALHDDDDVATDISFGSRVQESPSLAVWYGQQGQHRQQQQVQRSSQRVSAVQKLSVSHKQQQQQQLRQQQEEVSMMAAAAAAAQPVRQTAAGRASKLQLGSSGTRASGRSTGRPVVASRKSAATSMSGLPLDSIQQQQQQQPSHRSVIQHQPELLLLPAAAAARDLQQWEQAPADHTQQDLVWGSGAGASSPGDASAYATASEPSAAVAGVATFAAMPGSAGAPAQVLQIEQDGDSTQELQEQQLLLLQKQLLGSARLSGSTAGSSGFIAGRRLSSSLRSSPPSATAAALAAVGGDSSGYVDAGVQPAAHTHSTAGEWWAHRNSSQASADNEAAAAAAAEATPAAARVSQAETLSGISTATAADGLVASSFEHSAGLLRGSGAAEMEQYDEVSRQLRAQALQQQQQQTLLQQQSQSQLQHSGHQQQQEQLPVLRGEQASHTPAGADQHVLAPSIATAVKKFEHLLLQQQQQQPVAPQLRTHAQRTGAAAGAVVTGRPKQVTQTAAAAVASRGTSSIMGPTQLPQHLPGFPAAQLNPLFEPQPPAAPASTQPARGSSISSRVSALLLNDPTLGVLQQQQQMEQAATPPGFQAATAIQHSLQHVAVHNQPSVPAVASVLPAPAATRVAPTAAAAVAGATAAAGCQRTAPPPAPPLPPGGKLLLAPAAARPAVAAPATTKAYAAANDPPTAAAAARTEPLARLSAVEAAAGALSTALAAAQPGRDALLQAIRGGAKLHHVHRASMVAAQQAGLL